MKLSILLALLFSNYALASFCSKDAKTFCQGITPGKGQLAKCLQDYENELSPNCKQELKEYKSKTAKKNPCFEDLADLCTDLPATSTNLEYCLLKNESRLSLRCSNDFKSKKFKIITRNVCASDVANHCYSAISGFDGSVTRCLIQKRQSLTENCKKSINTKIEKLRKENPCFDSTEKYCPTQVKFADIQDCLEKQIMVLPPTCKKLVENELKKALANPCYKDLTRHCRAGISPNEQSHCLDLNEQELSRSCRSFRATEKDRINKMIKLCENDRIKFCHNVPNENGMVAKCLRFNKAKISKECANLL